MGQLLVLVNLPLVMAGMVHVPWSVVVLLIFAPTLMALIQLGLSRTREYDADRVAGDLTGDPEGLIGALGKLERRVGRFWEDIFLPGRRIPEPSLLRTHPPVESRIARLRALAPSRTLSGPPMAGHAMPALTSPQAQPRFRSFGFYWQGSRTADGNARKSLRCKVNQWRRLSFRPIPSATRFMTICLRPTPISLRGQLATRAPTLICHSGPAADTPNELRAQDLICAPDHPTDAGGSHRPT